MKKSAVVAMSGGVDSAVAAVLLKKQGFEVSGVFMEIYDDSLIASNHSYHACFGPDEKEDLKDAQLTAEKLKIPFYRVDLRKKYREKILNFFMEEYLKGNTPNPCTRCNQEMKFKSIMEELNKRDIHFDYFASGHYARIEPDPKKNIFHLKKALDLKKDQSYFLYGLNSDQMERTIFPLGKYKKEDVRKMAEEFELVVSNKAESQDFIAGGYHQLFNNKNKTGSIINSRGEIIGKHRGIEYYTIGQRKGIGFSASDPVYVIGKNSIDNTITVGSKEQLLGTELVARDLNWINQVRLTSILKLKARIRYQHREADAQVNSIKKNKVQVVFREPQLAITPGQAIVFYRGDEVMGGGIIEREVKHEGY